VGKWQCLWLQPVSPAVGFDLNRRHSVKPNGKVKGDDHGAARSKVQLCDHSTARVAGSKPAGACLLCLLRR
jgi:hypothetical protein